MGPTTSSSFVDRRKETSESLSEWVERRQFAETRELMGPEVRELAEAIDAYKKELRRRYVTLAEVLEVLKSLGYHK